mgnify:CR=1 FL=1
MLRTCGKADLNWVADTVASPLEVRTMTPDHLPETPGLHPAIMSGRAGGIIPSELSPLATSEGVRSTVHEE